VVLHGQYEAIYALPSAEHLQPKPPWQGRIRPPWLMETIPSWTMLDTIKRWHFSSFIHQNISKYGIESLEIFGYHEDRIDRGLVLLD
jgi:hypothetical protein